MPKKKVVEEEDNEQITEITDGETVRFEVSTKEYEKILGHKAENPLKTCLGDTYDFKPGPQCMPRFPTILFFGERRSGKSFAARDLLTKSWKEIPFGVVLTYTKVNKYWDDYVPERWIFQGMRHDVLENLKRRQLKKIAKYGYDDPKAWAFIIMDDIISNPNELRYDNTINSFFTEGRHLCISVCILSQHVTAIGPMLRKNTDLAVIQPTYEIDSVKILHKLFGGFITMKEWQTLINEICQNKYLDGNTLTEPKKTVRVLVTRNWEKIPVPMIRFAHWVADKVEPKPANRLCAPEYWKLSEEWVKEEEQKKKMKLDLDDGIAGDLKFAQEGTNERILQEYGINTAVIREFIN